MALKSLIAAGEVGEALRDMGAGLNAIGNQHASQNGPLAKFLDQTKLAGCVVPDTPENAALVDALIAAVSLPSDDHFDAATEFRFSKEDNADARLILARQAVMTFILPKLTAGLPANDV